MDYPQETPTFISSIQDTHSNTIQEPFRQRQLIREQDRVRPLTEKGNLPTLASILEPKLAFQLPSSGFDGESIPFQGQTSFRQMKEDRHLVLILRDKRGSQHRYIRHVGCQNFPAQFFMADELFQSLVRNQVSWEGIDFEVAQTSTPALPKVIFTFRTPCFRRIEVQVPKTRENLLTLVGQNRAFLLTFKLQFSLDQEFRRVDQHGFILYAMHSLEYALYHVECQKSGLNTRKVFSYLAKTEFEISPADRVRVREDLWVILMALDVELKMTIQEKEMQIFNLSQGSLRKYQQVLLDYIQFVKKQQIKPVVAKDSTLPQSFDILTSHQESQHSSSIVGSPASTSITSKPTLRVSSTLMKDTAQLQPLTPDASLMSQEVGPTQGATFQISASQVTAGKGAPQSAPSKLDPNVTHPPIASQFSSPYITLMQDHSQIKPKVHPKVASSHVASKIYPEPAPSQFAPNISLQVTPCQGPLKFTHSQVFLKVPPLKFDKEITLTKSSPQISPQFIPKGTKLKIRKFASSNINRMQDAPQVYPNIYQQVHFPFQFSPKESAADLNLQAVPSSIASSTVSPPVAPSPVAPPLVTLPQATPLRVISQVTLAKSVPSEVIQSNVASLPLVPAASFALQTPLYLPPISTSLPSIVVLAPLTQLIEPNGMKKIEASVKFENNQIFDPTFEEKLICPFCPLTFSSFSDSVSIHIGLFHLPPLNHEQTCDVVNCEYQISSRVDHLNHLHHHTKTSCFISSVRKLSQHLSQLKRFDNVKSYARLKSNRCPICQIVILDQPTLMEHIVFIHLLSTILSHIPAKTSEQKRSCPRVGCSKEFTNILNLVMHLASNHQLVFEFADFLLSKSNVNSCPFKSCALTFERSAKSEIQQHLDCHMQINIRNELRQIHHTLLENGIITNPIESEVSNAKLCWLKSVPNNDLKENARWKPWDESLKIHHQMHLCPICVNMSHEVKYLHSHQTFLLHLICFHFKTSLAKELELIIKKQKGEGSINLLKCSECSTELPTNRYLFHKYLWHEKALNLIPKTWSYSFKRSGPEVPSAERNEYGNASQRPEPSFLRNAQNATIQDQDCGSVMISAFLDFSFQQQLTPANVNIGHVKTFFEEYLKMQDIPIEMLDSFASKLSTDLGINIEIQELLLLLQLQKSKAKFISPDFQVLPEESGARNNPSVVEGKESLPKNSPIENLMGQKCDVDCRNNEDLTWRKHLETQDDVSQSQLSKYCQKEIVVKPNVMLNNHLIEHSYSKGLPFNNWCDLHENDFGTKIHSNVDSYTLSKRPSALENYCETCLEYVSDLPSHLKHRDHISTMEIFNTFVKFCQRRAISTKTTPVEDMNLFLELVHYKLTPVTTSLQRVLAMVSKLQYESHRECKDHIQTLISAKQGKPLRFLCYTCPHKVVSFWDMLDHLKSALHELNSRQRQESGIPDIIQCFSCQEEFKDNLHLRLHVFSPQHLGQDIAIDQVPSVKPMNKEKSSFCYLCKVNVNEMTHFDTSVHQVNEQYIMSYLKWCEVSRINPVSATSVDIINYLETVLRGNLKSFTCIKSLELVDVIHEGIDNTQVLNHGGLIKYAMEVDQFNTIYQCRKSRLFKCGKANSQQNKGSTKPQGEPTPKRIPSSFCRINEPVRGYVKTVTPTDKIKDCSPGFRQDSEHYQQYPCNSRLKTCQQPLNLSLQQDSQARRHKTTGPPQDFRPNSQDIHTSKQNIQPTLPATCTSRQNSQLTIHYTQTIIQNSQPTSHDPHTPKQDTQPTSHYTTTSEQDSQPKPHYTLAFKQDTCPTSHDPCTSEQVFQSKPQYTQALKQNTHPTSHDPHTSKQDTKPTSHDPHIPKQDTQPTSNNTPPFEQDSQPKLHNTQAFKQDTLPSSQDPPASEQNSRPTTYCTQTIKQDTQPTSHDPCTFEQVFQPNPQYTQAFKQDTKLTSHDPHTSEKHTQPASQFTQISGQDSQPTSRDPHTLEQDTQPTSQDPHTLEHDTQPTSQDLHSLEQDTQPTTQDPCTLEQDTQPTCQDPHTLEQDTQPTSQDSHTLEQDTQPISQDPHTLEQDTQPTCQDPHTLEQGTHQTSHFTLTSRQDSQPMPYHSLQQESLPKPHFYLPKSSQPTTCQRSLQDHQLSLHFSSQQDFQSTSHHGSQQGGTISICKSPRGNSTNIDIQQNQCKTSSKEELSQNLSPNGSTSPGAWPRTPNPPSIVSKSLLTYSSIVQSSAEVTSCPKCEAKFDHATHLLLHVVSVHKWSAREFLVDYFSKEVVTCLTCFKKCASPMIFALHQDRHHKVTSCSECKKNFATPSQYYFEDQCGKHNLSEKAKTKVMVCFGKYLISYSNQDEEQSVVVGSKLYQRTNGSGGNSKSLQKVTRHSRGKATEFKLSSSNGSSCTSKRKKQNAEALARPSKKFKGKAFPQGAPKYQNETTDLSIKSTHSLQEAHTRFADMKETNRGMFICRQCQPCDGKTCFHWNHSMVVMNSFQDMVNHSNKTGHTGCHPLSSIFTKEPKIVMKDLVHDKRIGPVFLQYFQGSQEY